MPDGLNLSDMNIWISLIGGYLLGAIPFGLVLTRMAGLGDIRTMGSGNIGATNVLRTGNKFLALLTLLLDSGKGAIAVALAYLMEPTYGPYLAGPAAFLGHIFPVWLRFKGGKGVATFLGTLFALSWPMGLVAAAAWLLSAFAFKISSLSALVATLIVALASYIEIGLVPLTYAIGFMAVLIFWAHRANIRRIIAGTEPKIGKKDK